jgi:hypothetical protein
MRVRRRLWMSASLLLLVLALLPRPAAAGQRELSPPGKRASTTVSRLWEAVRHLFPAQWVEKLGPEMDPSGLSSSNPPSPPPTTHLGPGMDPAG